MEEPTVFVIEDDPAVGGLIEKLLTSAGYRVALFDSPQAFLGANVGRCPGCAVIDVFLPGMTGLQLQEILADGDGSRPHIFLTGLGDVPMAVQAMKRGALGFLQKPFRAYELLQLVQEALMLDLRERAGKERRQAIAAQLETLTIREREVLDQIVQGLPNKLIAARLGISQRTVEQHRTRVMEKLSAESVAELVQSALAAGIAPISQN